MMKNLTLEHIAAACHGTYYGPGGEKKSVHRSSDNGQPENRKKLPVRSDCWCKSRRSQIYRSGHGAGSAGYLK